MSDLSSNDAPMVSPDTSNVKGATSASGQASTPSGSDFNQAIAFTSHPNVEGGYTTSGGIPTNYGITQETLNNYNSSHGAPQQDVKDITPDYSKQIAKEEYWDKPGLSALPQRTATAVFDYGFNSHPTKAIRDMQAVVGAKQDGLIGHNTMKAYNNYVSANGEDMFLDKYLGMRQEHYNNLINSNPGQNMQYAHGWAARIVNLRSYLHVPSSVGGQ